MIRSATQLKAKIRNISEGDSTKTQTLIRNFIMERFLERIALSPYRNNFILKGGMLVSGSIKESIYDGVSTVICSSLGITNLARKVDETAVTSVVSTACDLTFGQGYYLTSAGIKRGVIGDNSGAAQSSSQNNGGIVSKRPSPVYKPSYRRNNYTRNRMTPFATCV